MIGVTMGDANGVGPEIVLKAWRDGLVSRAFALYGEAAALRHYNARLGYGVPLRGISAPEEADGTALCVIDLKMLSEADVQPGVLSAAAGRAAREAVVRAAQAALAGAIDAVVTLPVNKQAIQLSDPRFTGHTELLGEVCGARDVTILLASEQLMVTHVSTHCSLREAIARVTAARLDRILELTCDAVLRLKPAARIAVAGLNPHAGEGGAFGDEEIRVIAPAVERARARGWPVEGPLPPDTVFHLAVRRGRFDAVVCMYHDQGHIPLKLLDFEGGVNVTLGLPIIRTSVDHGTAFDIAGRGLASPSSFAAAFRMAEKLAAARRGGVRS
ncbi:MAG: 4-hydroxythreonine-4-phosphate dehydrogenase 1 [Bryobacteraceae bacterium]|nr:MAG: 4-hydroxythreonine-4-phosphate dehydrogenase 1 [Bryobacteraceae bacterium]